MRTMQPGIDPMQLPPSTDDFTYCNASALHVNSVTFNAGDGGALQSSPAQAAPPDSILTVAKPPLQATHVVCDADLGAPMGVIHYEYDEGTPEAFVTHFICGIRNGAKGGVVPFAVVISSDGQLIALDQ